MTDVITVPVGARAVLEAVAVGLSPWAGWEQGTKARTPEGQEAYEARARIITACREHGLLTVENLLTERGRQALKSMAARHG
jgi:hypothetical protein